MKKQFSRYEINRMVKQVLVRHSVDLIQVQFSCSGETVYLYGDLFKDLGRKFTPREIEVMVKDLSKLPGVRSLQFDFNNWNISGELDAWAITLRK